MFSHARYYYLLHAAIFMVVLAVGWFVSSQSLRLHSLELEDYEVRECATAAASGGPVLDVLDAVYMGEVAVFEALCQAAELAHHFGAVAMRSVHRDRIDMRELYESRYELVLAKPELMGTVGQLHRSKLDYQLVAQYPDYGSQLISLHGVPELSAVWLQGKKLGLLDDPNSVSSYQIPTAALRDAGLSDVPETIYFRSYRQMIQALFSGRVDVIAVLLSNEGPDSRLKLPRGLVLEQTLPGPAWYVQRELMNTPIHCDLVAALQQLSRTAPLDYIKRLRVLEDCHGR